MVLKKESIPKYLKKRWGESRWQRIAGFRLGCRMRGGDIGRRRRREGNVGHVEGGRRIGNMYGRNVWIGE